MRKSHKSATSLAWLNIFAPALRAEILSNDATMYTVHIPAKRNLAKIRFTAHAGMKFKKLPHSLALHASTRDSCLTAREMTD